MDAGMQNGTLAFKGVRKGFIINWLARILAAVLVFAAALFFRPPASARLHGYGLIRELIKFSTVLGTLNMDKAVSRHFYVKFKPEDRNYAEVVLDTAERFYYPVAEDFGFAPPARVPLIIYSTREELNRSFGWAADESAMGVYWAGTIRVLSPGEWIDECEPSALKETFVSSGPMAHEFTHLVVDYLTGGNYPRWFTEGLAQYEEYKLTGFELAAPAGSFEHAFDPAEIFTDDFDSLPEQALAYRESLAAVRFIVCSYGEGALFDIIAELGNGKDFSDALKKATGLDEAGFIEQWRKCSARNW
ncbi:MAG TPA: hypothetical protein PK728_09315 [Bacillota bacterium]|nr:hypothetical protein [Bacillota bacterium]